MPEKQTPHVERNWKRSGDFSADDRRVIAERRKYQSASELAHVFQTTPQTIAGICRQHSPAKDD